jgi:PTH1 family peptidyl-tRNA hydrolase
MNVSGQALAPLVHFYKDAKLVVIHDDLDLACGHMRFKQGGGTGGHNGLRDLHRFIGPEYARIRLGIGHPGDKQAVHEYVLSPFSVSERQGVEKSVHTLICAIDLLLTGKEDLFIQTLHQHKA